MKAADWAAGMHPTTATESTSVTPSNGKQHLGMGDGQLRTAKGQTRYLLPVSGDAGAQSLLMAQWGRAVRVAGIMVR